MQNDYGYGAAISVMMLAISFVIILVMTRVRRGTRQDE
jgi:ABC-type sugar transport system permease subunit